MCLASLVQSHVELAAYDVESVIDRPLEEIADASCGALTISRSSAGKVSLNIAPGELIFSRVGGVIHSGRCG